MSNQQNHIYEFGPFHLDAVERLLLRDGTVVPLTPRVFDLLLVLVERHGHLLEKDELMKTVWRDTVVEEANLSANVSILRKALGENGQHFIETMPKRGYRFVAEVRQISAEQAEGNEPAARNIEGEKQPETLTSKVKRQGKAALLTLAALVIAIGGMAFGAYKFITRSENKSSGPGLEVVPFTSYAGGEILPAISPDGAQIAFSWDGPQEDNYDIWVKLVGAGEPLQLTTNPAPDLNPVWSPDGRYLAFTREGEGSGIYLVGALGGAERKLAEIFPQRPVHMLSLSYSPDGRYLAVADKTAAAGPWRVFLIAVETGDKRPLTSPPAASYGDECPAFSPDGKSLAFGRTLGFGAKDIYIVPVAGGEPRRITFDNAQTFGLTWTADGREIVFSALRNGGINLWRVPVAGGVPTRVEVSAQSLYHPVISRQGNRLAATQILSADSDIWRVQIASPTGQKAAPAKLIASTKHDNNPQYSPDGQQIVFSSRRSGSQEIWVCDREGRNSIQLTNMGVLYNDNPHWSPDGRQIAFACLLEGNRDIYVISANGGNPRRLTAEPAEEICPSWSREGQWIYFGSSRSGSMQIWKMPAGGGTAVQVTRQGGFKGVESPDGKYFYYTKGRLVPGIWRIALAGGEETLVLDHHRAGASPYWTVAEQGIYFATATTPVRTVIEFFSFTTGEVMLVATIEGRIGSGAEGLAVSPDSRWLLYSQLGQSSSTDILLIEHFR